MSEIVLNNPIPATAEQSIGLGRRFAVATTLSVIALTAACGGSNETGAESSPSTSASASPEQSAQILAAKWILQLT